MHYLQEHIPQQRRHHNPHEREAPHIKNNWNDKKYETRLQLIDFCMSPSEGGGPNPVQAKQQQKCPLNWKAL